MFRSSDVHNKEVTNRRMSTSSVLKPMSGVARRALVVAGLVGALIAPAAPTFAQAAPTATVTVGPASQTVPLGQNFSVDVNVTTTGPTLGFQLGVTYDATRVRVNSITRGNFLDDYVTSIGGGAFVFAQPWDTATAGTISVGGAAIINAGANPGPMGSGRLATISFSALNANGSSPITLTGAAVNGITAANTTVTNGSVVTGSVPLADLTVVAAPTPAVTGTPTQFNVAFQLRNGGTLDAPASVANVTVTGATPGAPQTVNVAALTAGATSAGLTAG